MTQRHAGPAAGCTPSDSETLLERLADEGLPVTTSLAELLAVLDARCARLAAGGAG